MKKNYITLLLLLFINYSFSQWQDLNTGINDDLTGVVFFGNQGFVSGEKGIYFTLNGGNGSSSWQRFEITDNTQNQTLYNNTKFTACYANPYSSENNFTAYAIGQDTINHKAVILSLEYPSMNYSIVSLNINNSILKDIDYCKTFQRFYAVGNNGLIIHFSNDLNNISTVSTSFSTDLTSISFNTSGYNGYIGANEIYYKLQTSGHFFTDNNTPGELHKDIAYYSTSKAFSVNEKYMRFNYANKYIINDYYHGPLNANTIFNYVGRHLIGTDHGIFLSDTNESLLEWQPSSGTHNINSFWRKDSSPTVYSCGSNGIVMKNDATTTETEPYVNILFDGGCAYTTNSSFTIDATIGSSNNCSWYIDNIPVSTNCGSFNHTFTEGSHDIKLEVDFNGVQAIDTKTIHVVNPPLVDLPYTISDSILCHEESIEISIDSSEPNVYYTLHKLGSNENFGSSPVGNNETIVLNSNLINESGTFFLRSNHNLTSNCHSDFTTKFDIIVEQTKADFHFNKINAYKNENVSLYQTSDEASTFNWSFNGANINNSTAENPVINFVQEGVHDISLTATSANLCIDEATKISPNILNEPADNSTAWHYLNVSESPAWSGTYTPDISHINKVTGGYISGGYYRNNDFGTNHGINFQLNDSQGTFLTKHDFKGTLKWIVYSKGTGRTLTTHSVEDQDGNIYISISNNASDFYDNSGKVISLDYGGSIVKLDQNGNYIWHMEISRFSPSGLHIDESNNLIILGVYDIYNDYGHYVQLNDIQTDEVGTVIFPDYAYRFCNAIIKATPNGTILWDNEIFSTAGTFGTSAQTRKIGHDNLDNLYIQGIYRNDIYLYHTGSSTPTHLTFHQYAPGGSSYSHLFKLDTNGALNWITRSYSIEDSDYGHVWSNDMKTDSNGNTYLVGYGYYYGANFNHHHYVENADGSIYSTDQAKTYYFKKINSNGICEWILGSDEINAGTSLFPKGDFIQLENDSEIKIMGRTKSNYTPPATVTFNLRNGDSVDATFNGNTNFFVASYDLNGTMNNVTVYDDSGTDPHYTEYTGFFGNNLNQIYASSNVGFSSEKNGRMSFFSNLDGVVYSPNTLSTYDYSLTNITNISPNPTNGSFNLNINKDYNDISIKIFDITGRVLVNFERKNLNQYQIPLEINNSSGIYFVKIILDNYITITKKIIKK